MTIEPDTKDWTWVLTRPCEACGFDASAVVPSELPAMVLAASAAWQEVLGGERVRERPSPQTWSPLEYGCHVRDVVVLYDQRLQLMLEEDDPTYANWDQDAAAIESRYDEQDPITVGASLEDAAHVLAARFATVQGDMWQRTGTRSDGNRFTIDSFARYFIHDPIHHLADVRS